MTHLSLFRTCGLAFTRPVSILKRPPSQKAWARFWSAALAVCLLVPAAAAPAVRREDADLAAKRAAMVRDQIEARGITDPRVLAALKSVPRHLFVPPGLRDRAYDDSPLPIGEGQTISQPYIVALMSECLHLKKGDKVLEVGTGSGYQAAVLAALAGRIYSIEIDERLAARAARTLAILKLENVRVKTGDGFFGWPEEAPFDAVILTCAAPQIPPRLFEQLADGGRLILPLGEQYGDQVLTLVTKTRGKPVSEAIADVRFVPMTGEILKKKR